MAAVRKVLIHLMLVFPYILVVKVTLVKKIVSRKVYCVSNVPFHAESKYAIKIFPSPTDFVQWNFLLLIFINFSYFIQ
jgi:hypothetical protein